MDKLNIEVVMMLKAEIVAEGGMQTVRDEATLERYAKAINAYPQLVTALRKMTECPRNRSASAMAVDLLRQIGEAS